VLGDLIDNYMRMSESRYHESMYWFYEDVIAVLGEYYLREPNTDDALTRQAKPRRKFCPSPGTN
jgi:hypothetical protein